MTSPTVACVVLGTKEYYVRSADWDTRIRIPLVMHARQDLNLWLYGWSGYL